jgi:hypothetical protein
MLKSELTVRDKIVHLESSMENDLMPQMDALNELGNALNQRAELGENVDEEIAKVSADYEVLLSRIAAITFVTETLSWFLGEEIHDEYVAELLVDNRRK